MLCVVLLCFQSLLWNMTDLKTCLLEGLELRLGTTSSTEYRAAVATTLSQANGKINVMFNLGLFYSNYPVIHRCDAISALYIKNC